MSRSRDLTDQATRCLTCACLNRENRAAVELLETAEALTATGVVAAIFLADSDSHHALTHQARHAIAEQRAWCHEHGAFSDDCVSVPASARRRGVRQ